MLYKHLLLINRWYKVIVILIGIYCFFCNNFANANNVHPFDKALTFLINKDYQSAKDIFNKRLQHHKVNVPQNLKSLLSEPFFFTEELSGNSLTLTSREELDYIRSAIIYKRLVKKLTEGLKSERDIIFTLFEWTVRNIVILGIMDGPALNAFPYDFMMRGFGCCDRSAWVLATLAYQAGYHANVISMHSHAITQIYLEDTWALFDPHFGIIFKNDKKLLGLDDRAEIEQIIKDNDLYGDHVEQIIKDNDFYGDHGFADLMKSNIVTICEPLSILPKMKILQNILNRNCMDPPRVYYDLLGELSFTISTMDSSLPNKLELPVKVPYTIHGKTNNVLVWLSPFEGRFSYKCGSYNNNLEKHFPQLKHYKKARECQIMGDFENALDEYDKIFSQTLNLDIKESLIYNKALCYYEIEDYAEAKKLFLFYRRNYPHGKEIKGVEHHLGLIKDDNIVKFDNNINLSSIKKSENDDYHYRLRNSIMIDTKNSYFQIMSFSSYCQMGNFYNNSGKADKAISALEKALEINPNDSGVCHVLGKLYMATNDFVSAIKKLTKTLEMDPQYNVYQELGNAYFKNGEFNKSEGFFLKVIELEPSYIDAHFMLAKAYIENGKYDNAIFELKKTLELNPDLNNVRYNLGTIYFAKGKLEYAKSKFEKVLKNDPDFADAHYVLSLTYNKANNHEKASYHCDKALALGVNIPEEILTSIKNHSVPLTEVVIRMRSAMSH